MKETQLRKIIKEELLKEGAQEYFERNYRNMFGDKTNNMIRMSRKALFQLMEEYAEYVNDIR